jgi:phosphoribosyl-AMP cyclohydrolase
MDMLVEHLLKNNVIDVGEVRISRTSLGKSRGSRYLIYLPTARNYLWQAIHTSGAKVRIYIEIATETAKRVESA